MDIRAIHRPLHTPFSITGHTFTHLSAVWVTVEHGSARGWGEGVGMYYRGETSESMTAELESVRSAVEAGATRTDIQGLLGPGGARNALDCALWDLECKSSGHTIFDLVGVPAKPLVTVATIGMGTSEEMAEKARGLSSFPHLKVKLDDNQPIERLRAVRAARPDATLVVDVNQGWTIEQLRGYLPELADIGVAMVEQPLPRGREHDLEGLNSPLPIGGDESVVDLADYRRAGQYFDVINIKLDKCGGLTAALEIAEQVRFDGKDLMVGNMTGTSLSMAPSHVIGQWCRFVDIDGPVLLAEDISPGLNYLPGGIVEPPAPELWG